MAKISVPFMAATLLLFAVHRANAEILSVDSYGTPTVISSPTVPGQTYLVHVSGTFIFDNSTQAAADAEWSQFNPVVLPTLWRENPNSPVEIYGPDALDLLVDEIARDWSATPDGLSPHVFNQNHEYWLEIPGTGTPFSFRIADGQGSMQMDNSGILQVEITPVPEPVSLTLFGVGVAGLLLRRRRGV